MAHRVVLILNLWIALWAAGGAGVGYLLFGTMLTGAITGFFLGLLATFLWPWIMPDALDRWMDDTPT